MGAMPACQDGDHECNMPVEHGDKKQMATFQRCINLTAENTQALKLSSFSIISIHAFNLYFVHHLVGF